MRKVLLVQNEQYLDRALQDVGSLMAFEQRHIGKEKQVDLLAVILLSPEAMAQVIAEQPTCDLLRFARSATPFTCDSVSVNGVWLLLTIKQPDLPHHVSRQEALSQMLGFLRTNGYVQSMSTIFPVFSPEDDEWLIAEQMAYLKNEHPKLTHHPLVIDSLRRAFLSTSTSALHSHVE